MRYPRQTYKEITIQFNETDFTFSIMDERTHVEPADRLDFGRGTSGPFKNGLASLEDAKKAIDTAYQQQNKAKNATWAALDLLSGDGSPFIVRGMNRTTGYLSTTPAANHEEVYAPCEGVKALLKERTECYKRIYAIDALLKPFKFRGRIGYGRSTIDEAQAAYGAFVEAYRAAMKKKLDV